MAKKSTSKKTSSSSKPSKPPSKSPHKNSPDDTPPNRPTSIQDLQDQQRLLNIFSYSFNAVLSSEVFPVLLQEIKQALFNRDFEAAFGREDYLEAYAARWSPTRALCYASVLQGIDGYVDEIALSIEGNSIDATSTTTEESPSSPTEDERPSVEGTEDDGLQVRPETSTLSKRIKMLSIGGCAAEHIAFASYLHNTNSHGTLTLLDSAPWTHVTSLLQSYITTPPPISKYASAALKASNRALLNEQQLSLAFSQSDILSVDKNKLAELVGAEPLLVTLMFTLNELYTDAGIGKTTKFLKTLGEVLPSGSLLLVVDSPGSYSEAAVGKEKKKYPMQWLLNHTLLETKTPNQDYGWERLESQDSVWFRLPEGLSYPIQLENMRYQMHLYRREAIS